MNTVVADTNIFLRFFLRDVPSQYSKAKLLFEQAKNKKLKILVPQIVIFEVHFALIKFYGFGKSEIIDTLNLLVSTAYFHIES